MKQFAFVSRHQPTPEQVLLAKGQDIELNHVGDMDAFNMSLVAFKHYKGVIVVHPEAALVLFENGTPVGVFENQNRAPIGQPPAFVAKSLRIHYP